MLRAVVALLLLANALFYAWAHGWLGATGEEREPERLQRQVNPQGVRVLPPASAAAFQPVGQRRVCLEAGPLPPEDLGELEAALRQAGVPEAGWQRSTTEQPGRHLVVMGRFADAEQLQRKRAELQRRQVPFEPVRDLPELEPGLVLGSFDRAEAAEAALADLGRRGVRTARVVTVQPPQTLQALRLGQLDPEAAAVLAAGPAGPALRPCASADR